MIFSFDLADLLGAQWEAYLVQRALALLQGLVLSPEERQQRLTLRRGRKGF
jgi:hypothetical protein